MKIFDNNKWYTIAFIALMRTFGAVILLFISKTNQLLIARGFSSDEMVVLFSMFALFTLTGFVYITVLEKNRQIRIGVIYSILIVILNIFLVYTFMIRSMLGGEYIVSIWMGVIGLLCVNTAVGLLMFVYSRRKSKGKPSQSGS